jgi:hypothetical protein
MTENGRTAEKSLGDVVNDVSTKASLLVREEIELAKTEVTEKARSLGKGAALAAVAGVMGVFALIYFFEGLAWFFNDLLDVGTKLWIGFGLVFILLCGITGLAAALGIRWIKKGSPPTPDMAIEEAKLVRADILEHN